MAIMVEITRADVLPDLVAALGRGGCAAERVSPTACRVAATAALGDEASVELAFFVRAWQLAHPGVGAELRRPSPPAASSDLARSTRA